MELSNLADEIAKILPKSAHKKIAAIMDALTAYVPVAVHADGGRLEVDRVEFPGVAVGLDASGNAVAIHLESGWSVEHEAA